MKKLLFSLAIASFLMVSCDNQEPANTEEQTEEVVNTTPKALDINKFDEMADALANKLVEVSGTVVHTCKHGGTKMFITGNDPDFRLKVTATDESGNFNLEMEGNDYVVIGILDEYRMDMAELDKMEADVLADAGVEDFKHKKNEGEGSDHADHGGDQHANQDGHGAQQADQDAHQQNEQQHANQEQVREQQQGDQEAAQHQEAEGSCETELAQIADLRAQVKESGKGYLSFYSILAKSYKEVK